eukprot:Blabericola_migrator_1__2141@NODE_1591_length_4215_cov_90_581003_g364_i3_p2_GENE_NODE_1591_length_4215_cov_90_581003_g364_i3NODE_1591_length_4215_cov_90_581003_g364_i3_p2_ORF_typecomplete_len213_score27_59GM_CSF/PF01109_17/0_052_NODE_1591_length_4215_cov_90_581003_g364_i322512889
MKPSVEIVVSSGMNIVDITFRSLDLDFNSIDYWTPNILINPQIGRSLEGSIKLQEQMFTYYKSLQGNPTQAKSPLRQMRAIKKVQTTRHVIKSSTPNSVNGLQKKPKSILTSSSLRSDNGFKPPNTVFQLGNPQVQLLHLRLRCHPGLQLGNPLLQVGKFLPANMPWLHHENCHSLQLQKFIQKWEFEVFALCRCLGQSFCSEFHHCGVSGG